MPDGDTVPRMVCRDCGWVHYENPRVVVTTVSTWEDRILLCRRAIGPREGFWTLPGGFMEVGESAPAGALRETLEETGARVEIDDLLAVYSLGHIGQVHLVYRAHMLDATIECGPESLEAGLFEVDRLPFGELAFPTNEWALRHFLDARDRFPIAPYTEPLD